MKIACLAFLLLFAAFAVHWILWHIRVPLRQSAGLLVIFLGVLPVGMAIFLLPPVANFIGPLTFWECMHISIFQVAMALGYVANHSGVEGRSPSLALLVLVAKSGQEGKSREELLQVLNSDCPVENRLQAMLRDGMIVEEDGAYLLTPKGRLWAVVFSYWRNVLKLKMGG
jgi:hypothetical protein